VFVWPTTAAPGTSTGTWFHWVKVYSALAGCLGFLALRFIKGASANKWMLMFPPFILGLNIFEAVIRDFHGPEYMKTPSTMLWAPMPYTWKS
ncbi:DUF5692 family protein, partial [Bacillus cereus group sp. Bce019]|uniref:DUF5692 family protein n=1 Tax=Bacillus cereus group sp. Bce019 TaxID=3445247 RepID=UPI003F27DD21